MKSRQGNLYTIIFTFIVCFVFVFLLSLTNVATREQVELNEILDRQRAILSAMDIEFSDDDEVQQLFQQEVERVDSEDSEIYSILVDGERVYAKLFAGPGLWGTISGVLAVDERVERTVGIEFISQNETPGLGGRITESWFKEQLRGERIIDGTISLTGPGTGDSDPTNGAIDGITGATRTSDAMRQILAVELEALREALNI